MDAYEVSDLLLRRTATNRAYLEFLRHPSMSLGLYVLAAGGRDPQTPHDEDEVYVVVRGRGRIRVGDEDRPVEAGSIVFVPKRVEHRFHSIDEELVIVVGFAPPEGSAAR